MKRRLLAFLLALSMMVSLVPVNAFAVGTGETETTAATEAAQTEAAETTAPVEVPETEPEEPAMQTEAEEPDAEEDLVAPLADTEQEDILSNIGFVRAEDSAEKVSMHVNYFATTWTFSVSRNAQTQTFWATFQYDPATTEFFYIRDPGLAIEGDEEQGIMRIGGNGGELYAGDYTFEIAFLPKTFGDATVTLKSFEVDGKDYLSAPIAVATTVCCSASWDEDPAYTVTGEKLVEAGKDYTFTVAANEGYDASKAVVKVNDAEVTGTDGTYTVKNVDSDLKITVEGVTEAVKAVAGLSALKFTNLGTGSAKMYELVPAFDPAVKEYTVLVPDSAGNIYVWATQAEDRSSGTTITAKWVNLKNNSEKTQALTSGKTSGQVLLNCAPSGMGGNTITITVADGDFTDIYTIKSVRTPSLTALSLDGVRFNETFNALTNAYTAKTTNDSVTVAATPKDAKSTVTYNGGADAVIPLSIGENKIEVVVANESGYTNTYTITVTRVESVEVNFSVDPADAKVTVWDPSNDRLAPKDGKYIIMPGAEYTYLVQKDGYVSQKSTFTFTESSSIVITLLPATENPNLDKSIQAEWGNFRNGDNNLGITDARTPYAPEDAELLWAVKYGTGWAAAPGSPILVDGDIYTYSGSTVRRLNSMTGEVVAEGAMVAQSSYSIVPMTYGDGMVFVGLSGGRIQAFNAKTLESLWVYTDDLGGQPNCPITYKDGYVYAGFWNSEEKDANFACINTIDEDHASTTEAKYASWTYTRAGGFYWAGAYVTDKLAIVGTDDGAGGYNTNGAALLVFDRYTGALLDSHEGIRGDLRSNVSHDPDSDRVFFTTKGGILGNAQIDWDTGKILDYKETVIKDAQGNANAMSTCTPSVYNGRIYIGVAGTSQFGANSGHGIAVYDLNGDGSMTQAYVYAIIGYPQTSAMVSTAYSAEDGYVYIYLPYNYTPGGISVLKDRPGQTAPLTTTGSGYSEVFTPAAPLAQYCICSTIADQYGTIYYKNDSCYMMAITSKIESLEITQEPTITENEDGTLKVEGLKAVTKLKNGQERDVSSYVSVTKNEQTGGYTVSYTYGFDDANYGRKTVTAEIAGAGHTVTIPEGEGYTVTGEKTVKDGEDYTFTVTVAEGYDASNMVVKVNDTEVTAVDGVYTVEKVSSNLTITVEGVTKAPVYTIGFEGLSAKNLAVDSNFAGKFTFGVDTDVSFKTFAVTFKYDPAVVTYSGINPGGIGAEADDETGTLTLSDQDFMFTAGEQNTFQIVFKAKAFGDATVTLKSFQVDGKEILSESIAMPAAVGYKVSWAEDAAYTVTGEKYADVNGTYTFTVAANKGYDASNAMVKVNGEEVTAADGKYTVEKVSSDLTITVEGVTKAAANGLSALRFGTTGSISSAKYFEMSPSFDPAVKEYTLLIPDSTNGIYAWATRGADLTTKASIKAAWTSMSNGKASNTTLTSGSSTGKTLSGFNIAGAESNTLTITVTDGDVKDVYTIKTVRIDPTLTKLALDGMKLNETFVSTKKAYTAVTAKDSVTILATPRGKSYTVTYNGGTDNTIPLSAGENKIEIVVTNKDGYTNSYTLTVTKADHSVTFPTDESCIVTGDEAVMDGADYTFQVAIDYRYEAGEDFAVKVNGETVTGESGKYTVKNVKTDLVITVEGVKWKVLEPVTVYFSFSHDDKFEFCNESGQTMALKEVTVPYFDLALYGLEDFYFSSEDYGPASGDPTGGPGSALEPGTKEFAYGKVTMFHLFIYATEVYYLGIDPADAGKGYLKDNGLGTSVFNVTGSTGSTFLQEIWNYDLNLNYYLNYVYPLASAGWGSTSDQILLHDGDIVTLGHFTDWSFFNDSTSVFNYINADKTDVAQGEEITLSLYHAGADMGGSYGTAHTLIDYCPDVYCAPVNSITSGDVTMWTRVGTAKDDGTLVVDTSTLVPGEYIFALAGQPGKENPDAICSTPGGIRLTIHEKPVVKGDINGDGVLDVTDINALYSAIVNEEELDASVADINGDGVIDVFDVMALYNSIQNDD